MELQINITLDLRSYVCLVTKIGNLPALVLTDNRFIITISLGFKYS